MPPLSMLGEGEASQAGSSGTNSAPECGRNWGALPSLRSDFAFPPG